MTIQMFSVLLSFFWTLKFTVKTVQHPALHEVHVFFAGVGVFTYSVYVRKSADISILKFFFTIGQFEYILHQLSLQIQGSWIHGSLLLESGTLALETQQTHQS